MLLALTLLWLPAVVVSMPAPRQPARAPRERLRPTIPQADRHQPGKIFVEYADRLMTDRLRDSADVQILVGNVQLRKGDMFMYCDSARFNQETSSLEAFDNVRMEQGDTLFVYGDMLFYDGITEIAELQAYAGRDARLINRDVSLTTPVVFYDMVEDVGYYTTGGTLTDKTNTLNSMQGYYYPSTKDSYFYLDVDLTGPREGDTLRMFTDSLAYNTDTGIAELLCKTLILGKDGEINSTSGKYYTRTGVADLFDRSTVHTWRGNTLTGDTLYYDRNKGFGEAFGRMVLTDSAGKSSIIGDYGFYDELRDSAFVTGNALALEYSRADTLYLHADTITAKMYSDSSRVTDAFHRVRFFRRDVQGLCDSMSMVERDSILYMYYNPILWNGDKQVVGNVIYLHFNDSTADWARLPEVGLVSQHIGEDCYNQFTGSDMTAWMTDTVIDRVYAEGNVQVIMFPMENDSTYNKYAYTESSYMDAFFEDNDIKHLVMWPQTSGKVTPLYLAKRNSYYLPKFRWYGALRPLSPDDIFYYPPEMADLYGQSILGKMSKGALTARGQALGKPKPPALPKATPPADIPAPPDSVPAMLPDTVPAMLPDSVAPLIHDSVPPLILDNLPEIPPDSVPPVLPDSVPAMLPDSLNVNPPRQ